MSIVTLLSGGIDSTLMCLLTKEEGIKQYPLFINYGQLSAKKEWAACQAVHKKYDLPNPVTMNLDGIGQLISSGLTNPIARINEDAFLPGRNLFFLLAGATYAYQIKAGSVGIGLLNEEYRIFPDQTEEFLTKSEELLSLALGVSLKVVAPLMKFSKRDVLRLATARGIEGTYSCHMGKDKPCGICVSCIEINNALAERG
jgi:7-cyano-7-deazaguanine synthase